MPLDINRPLSQQELKHQIKYYIAPAETAFHIHITIDELLKNLRSREIYKDVFYFYAIDHDYKLYGVIPVRDILFTPLHKRLIDIVDEDIVTLYEGVTLEHALKILTEHQFLSVPVVDDEYRLVGIFEIKPTDIGFIRRFRKRPVKETQDIFQIIGFTTEKNKLNSKWTEYCYRMPWLVGNLAAGFICAAIAAYFWATLSAVVILSAFIPLVLTLAESISMQSMAISLQFLYYKSMPWKDVFKRLLHEGFVSLLLGLSSALLLIFYFMLGFDDDWHPDGPMLAIALSIFLCMTVSASFGTLFPLILHKLNLDPKIASGPVVLMITDIMTTAIYLGLATWILL